MFVRIGNTPRDYAWGSTTAIAGLLGTTPSGAPEAELWLGAHPGSPARILDSTQTDGATDLAHWTETSGKLPYLLKVLAAASPLSLQAHPSSAQALAGFERENAEGLAPDSPERNYKDPFHKPEMIFALSDPFDALCGFREPTDGRAALERLAGGDPAVAAFAATLDGPAAEVLRRATEWLLGGAPEVADVVDAVVAAARDAEGVDADTVRMLAAAFPGDPGIVLALLLNRVALGPGDALYLPAGNIHAYLRGLGIELMAASDNVLRGGLTPKRRPRARAHPRLRSLRRDADGARTPGARCRGVRPRCPRLPAHPDRGRRGRAVGLRRAGRNRDRPLHGRRPRDRGCDAVVTEDELRLSVVGGAGTLFLATPNR